MEQLTSVEEYEFKGPYVEYQIKKLSPGWAWWYQSLGEILPEPESINLTKTEQDSSLGEIDLEKLMVFDGEIDDMAHDDSMKVKTLFPEVPNSRERKTLMVSQISGHVSVDSPVVVLDSGEETREEDKLSVQAEASTAEPPVVCVDESVDCDHQCERDLGWHLPTPADKGSDLGDKWFIEVCCEPDSLMSQQAEKNGWTALRITQANPLQSIETQCMFGFLCRVQLGPRGSDSTKQNQGTTQRSLERKTRACSSKRYPETMAFKS
eukprot:5376573-Amphidinium_carterae.1